MPLGNTHPNTDDHAPVTITLTHANALQNVAKISVM